MKHWMVALMAAGAITSGYAQTKASAGDVVKTAVETVVKAVKADPASRNGDVTAIAKVVEQKFLPYTDFRRTTRLVTGAAWNTATPAQQNALYEQFQTMLVHTYALQLSQLRGQQISFGYGPATVSGNGNDAVVHADVKSPGDTLQVGYRLGKTSDGWKIYDIDMMGAWLIIVYRQQFAERIAQGGIDGLIKYLQAHNARFGQ